MPKRYLDIIPAPPAALPPPSQPPSDPDDLEGSATLTSQGSPATVSESQRSSAPARVATNLNSPRNIFGLFRQYHATSFPQHDPDENLTSGDLVDVEPLNSSSIPAFRYQPYPNLSSFLLAEWFWNDGAKKSQSTFKNLIKIVGNPVFRPEDVAKTPWTRIDRQLGGDLPISCSDNGEDEGIWDDEEVCGDWQETPIKIKVPFHRRTLHPGQKEFEVGKLRHRKLTSVIREKISRPSDYPHIHFEPYKLYWQPNETSEAIRVHNELYSSEAFIDSHRELQDSLGEPGCELPRVVIGLMFSSDGTQLTAFSNAKLWPVYLAFGNESKDRRSKPSFHLFEHIAYFETVSEHVHIHVAEIQTVWFNSFRMPSRLSQQSTLVEKDLPMCLCRIAKEKFMTLNGRLSSTMIFWRHMPMEW
jgi:Plavaka transposase